MFKFYGSKLRAAPRYPTPELDTIIEPFAGSAAYSVLHRSARRVVLIEKDDRVVDLWRRVLRMDADELRSLPAPAEGEMSSDLLVAFASARTTRDTPQRFTVTARMAERFGPMVTRMAEVIDECRHFEIIEGDYTDAPDIEATWFIDPPYEYQGGRVDRSTGGRYRYGSQLIDFERLGTWCLDRKGQVIVCEKAGAGWLPWTHGVTHLDGGHQEYGEVWFHRSTVRLFG